MKKQLALSGEQVRENLSQVSAINREEKYSGIIYQLHIQLIITLISNQNRQYDFI